MGCTNCGESPKVTKAQGDCDNCKPTSKKCTGGIMDAKCVKYKLGQDYCANEITCLNISNGDDFQHIIEEVDRKLCEFTTPVVLPCFSELTGIGLGASYDELLEALQDIACTIEDKFVKIDLNDTTSGYLNDKLVVANCIERTILNPGGNEKIQLKLNIGCFLDTIDNDASLTQKFCELAQGCPNIQLPVPTPVPVPIVPCTGITGCTFHS